MRYRSLTYTRRCVCASKKEEKPNGVYFEIRKKNEDEKKKKSKIESCSFAILYTKKRIILSILSTIIVFFFRSILYIYIFKSRIDIQYVFNLLLVQY
jgi:hypothetical protein